MDEIKYSQREGFTPFNLPKQLDAEDGTNMDEWRAELGYIESVWLIGDSEGLATTARAWKRVGGDVPLTKYLVWLEDADRVEFIFVDELADLIALRIQLATMCMAPDIQRISEAAEKAFRAWHGHAADGVCPKCSPHEYVKK